MNKIDFSELIVTADSHEQANCEVKTRVLCLQKFVEENGGCFQVEHLGDGYGLDYKVEGYYKDKEVSLGIEYKQFLNDFVPNHGTLEKRLGAAREHYDNIALVIEGEALARTSRLVGDKNIWYVNPAVQDGLANQLMNRQMFEDRMQVWAESGILIRNIKLEEDFPDTFLYLLEYITKTDDWYSKHKIDLPNTSFKNQYINMILSLGIDKIGLKTAQKITTIYPNPYWLIVDGEDNLKDNIGKVTGNKLFNFFNNKDLITVEWQNGGNKAQLSKETKKSLKSNPEQSSEVKNPELAYLDNHDTKCIEVPKGKYQNGGQLFDINSERDQDIETLQSSSTEIEVNAVREPLTTSKVSTPDTLPEAPEQSEFKANPRLKDVVEFIRRHPRKTEDVGKEFGLSPEYNLKVLYALWHEHKKIWFEKSTCTWNFGCDKNPVPVVAEKELDIGV